MNKDRRERLEAILAEIEEIRDEEEEAFNSLPESLQGGAKGEAMESAIEALGEAVDAVTTAMEAGA